MKSTKKTENNPNEDKIDLILSIMKQLSEHINSLDERLSRLEDNIDHNQFLQLSNTSIINNETKITDENFENLDEHLRRTYQTLASAQKPLTATEVAERMGRSRSTISYHLNRLENLNLLEKFSGKTKGNSRSIFFKPKYETFDLENSEE